MSGPKRDMGDDKGTVKSRSILKIGNSLAISLPPKFIERCHLKKGEKLAVIQKDNFLKVIPMSDI